MIWKQRRVTKQPLEFGSAGSTFKRPEGYFAGKLIEDAGLRGIPYRGHRFLKTLRICYQQRKCDSSPGLRADAGSCKESERDFRSDAGAGSEKDRRVLGCVLLSLRECREQESLRL